MVKWPYRYLIKIQYLGFRFHGWQRQSELKTLQLMVEKTLFYVFNNDKHKILGAGRTDAKVSANDYAFELFLREDLNDDFFEEFNRNLPNDLRAISIQKVDAKFNIIQDSKFKEYVYLFSSGEKNHPFCAPIMTSMPDVLDIELMQKGAKLFEGIHWFKNFCCKPKPTTKFVREMLVSEVVDNDLYTANFFPKNSFLFRVKSKGFMRYQVRLMMGTLFELGLGNIALEDIEKALIEGQDFNAMPFLAPSSGLILQSTEFE